MARCHCGDDAPKNQMDGAYFHAAASACTGEGNVWFAITRAGEADVATLAKCAGCGHFILDRFILTMI